MNKYNEFKELLTEEVSSITNSDVILLSGGVDSGLILAIAIKVFKKHPTVSTIYYNPSFDMNERDYYLSRILAYRYGVNRKVAFVMFNEHDIEILKNYRAVMSKPHLSIGFHNALKNMQGRAIWTGQNADALYSYEAKNNRPGCIVKRISYMIPYIRHKVFERNLLYTKESSDSLVIKHSAEFNQCGKELLGREYKYFYPPIDLSSQSCMNFRQWEQAVMNNTAFGRELKKQTGVDKLTDALNIWWNQNG